ncbi:unnamed protein product [Urochloa decumbens]|uniref:F-box domain-containing protein n=1 Tax=Urochloa decumbens TaxID=240449 RepID=A0ABC9GEH6_9POAL
MAQSGGGGGGMAAKRGKLSSSGAGAGAAGEDRLSALPDDVLVLILVRIGLTAEAARTSVLSRRWRHLWPLLPELRFDNTPDGHRIGEVLGAPDPPPPLRFIYVFTEDSSPDSLEAWLPVAARRLSGDLFYFNALPFKEKVEEEEEEEEEEEDQAGESDAGAVQLPCFENATGINISLALLGLTLPPAGTFARLVNLALYCVRLRGPCELSDVVSSQRCPSLQRLTAGNIRGVDRLTIHSETLLELDLYYLKGLLQLTVVAPKLKVLKLLGCFDMDKPVASISAPRLQVLKWRDSYDPSSVQLGDLGQLRRLKADCVLVYCEHGSVENRRVLNLWQQFRSILMLNIVLTYPPDIIGSLPYSIEDITVLPRTIFLTLEVKNEGHNFGPSSFHMLRLCTGIRRLSLVLNTSKGLESACQSGCTCDQPANWKTEELSLNRLTEVEGTDLRGAEHEVVFMERLFSWATMLKKMEITFDYSVTKSKARELLQTLASFSRPEALVEFYMYDDADKESTYMLTTEDKEL